MKVTGTKKLLIILCALMCALTAGIGVMFVRSAFNHGAGVAYAKEELPPASGEQGASSDTEEEISAVKKEAEESQDNEEAAEKAYDPRFDEGAIAEIAKLTGLDSDFVTLYCHVKDIDANALLTAIVDAQEDLRINPEKETSFAVMTPDGEVEGELPEEERDIDKIYDDIHSFASEYSNGNITVNEDEDYFIAPDEVSSYATYQYYGIRHWTTANYCKFEYQRSTDGGVTWTNDTTVSLDPYFDAPLPSPSFQHGSWMGTDGKQHYVYECCGERTVIKLAPGEMFRIKWKVVADGSSSGYTYGYGHDTNYGGGNGHWCDKTHGMVSYGWTQGATNYWPIDGDAPTGTVFFIRHNIPPTNFSYEYYTQYNRRNQFFTWHGDLTSGLVSADSVTSDYAKKGTKYLDRVFIVQRTGIEKPQLVNDVTEAGDSVSGNTKTAYFRGDPVTISMTPDFGAGLVEYAFYTDASCTVPDDTVSLVIRSMHGYEGVSGTNMTFRSSVAGRHYIRLRIIQPPASPYLPSTAMKWSDGTNTPITFVLDIQMQRAQRPTVLYETGVASNGQSKTVYYTGEEQTVTFNNFDGSLLWFSSNGVTGDYDEATKTLVLKQTERGTYTINLYIRNTAGCSWADTGLADMMQFTFYIKEMLIDRTLNLDNPSVFTLHENYTGVEHVLEVGPAEDGQLIVIAPGINYSYLEKEDGTKYIKFSVVDSGTQEIIIRPAKGFIWKDTRDQATITFTITIDAIAIDFPTLLKEDGCKYPDERTKSVVFDPAIGWKGTLIIQGIPKQAIEKIGLNTAMEVLSWEPSAEWLADPKNKDKEPLDVDRTVLTLGATNANTYPVIVSITDPNFTWRITTSSADYTTFNLFIDKFELYAPMIAGDTREEWVGDIIKNPLASDSKYNDILEPDFATVYADGQKKIEGLTKTVYYKNYASDEKDTSYTPDEDKYFRLYAGGFTSNNQITINYSKSGLTPNYRYAADGVPYLELRGTNAGNYIIDITPTGNYRWADGTTDMKTFKFVIIPIFRDSLEMFIQKDKEGNNWEPIPTFDGSVTYDGDEHKFRIGNPANPSQNFDAEAMRYDLVDQAYNPIGGSAYPAGFVITEKTVSGVKILEGSAVHAGVYVIRLQLKNENYSWRQGQGVDMYYTFRITAKSIKNPVLMKEECSGGAGQKVEVVDDDDNHYVYGGYNGNNFQMVIGFTLDGLDPSELELDYNPSGIDFDPDNEGKEALWGKFNENVDEVGLTRLIVNAKIVGTHTLQIRLKNNDYKWASEGKYYEFKLIIDFAQVEFVNFAYGDPEDATPIGSDGTSYVVEYEPDPEKLHEITVTRADNDFDTTPFDTMFRFEIVYNKPSYEIKESTFNADNLVLGFKDANTYYINIYLTSNYTWKKERMRPNTLPVRMTLIVNPKTVDIPLIVDEGEKDDSGNSIANVDNSTLTKTVTYDTNTVQSIALSLGDDFRAFEVDTALSTTYLNEDKNVTPLKDKKLRYTAKSAGTYVLVITLADTNNYDWSAGTNVTYTLKILPRTIDVPQAFFIHNKDLNDPHTDYDQILGGAKGEEVLEDATSGKFEKKSKYTGEAQYIYLFGYAIENSEVNISVVPSNPANKAELHHQDVSVGGERKGHFVSAKYVNVYTITVEFKLSAEFSTPNCHWQSISMGTDVLPREFYLEIEKKVVDLPYILDVDPLDGIDDTQQAWAPDSYGFDSLSKSFVYDKADKGPSIQIGNCLDSSPIKYMDYGVVENLTDWRLDTSGNHVLTFSINNRATVGTEYLLIISLDTANECWDTTVTDDTKERHIYIVIEKKGVARPTMVVESDGATYSTTNFTNDTKTVEFDESKTTRPAAMKISGVDSELMRYSNSQPSDRMWSNPPVLGEIVVDVTDKNCDTYSVIITLEDDVNLKWDGTTDDSSPAEFMFVIAPKQYTRPEIDSALCFYDATDFANGLVIINAEDFTTVYKYDFVNSNLSNKDIQSFVIKNYINDPSIMTVDISTGKAFTYGKDASETGVNGAGTLTYGAKDAGIYKVVIKPSQNATWATGDPGDIVFTMEIKERQHKTPTLDISDASTPPDTSVVYTNPKGYVASDGTTALNDTKTVTYALNGLGNWLNIIINNYDDSSSSVMQVIGLGPDGKEFINNSVAGSGILTFSALKAGTYTITIKIRDDLAPNNCFDNSTNLDEIVYTFVIKPLELAVPVFDGDSALLQLQSEETVSASGDTFTVVYDGKRHANILLNVLGSDYMTFLGDENNNKAFGNDATKYFLFEAAPHTAKILAGASLDSIYRPSGNDMKPALTASPLVSAVDKENYIRLDAIEPGTYKLTFTLTDKEGNVVWAGGGTDLTKTVTFIVNKKRVAAPEYMSPPNNSKPYTGSDITFQIRNVFGATGDGITYTTAPTYIFETVSAAPTVAGEKKEMKIVSLDTTTNILTVSAVEMGTYKVTVSIIEAEKEHVEWTTSGVTKREFFFTITSRPITPTIEFGDALDSDGNPVTLPTLSPMQWPKDFTVYAIVTFPDVSVKKNERGNKVLDLDLSSEIYYKNAAGGSAVNKKLLFDTNVITQLQNAPQTLTTPGVTPIKYPTSGDIDGFNVYLMPSGEFNVVYRYKICPADSGEMVMGSYKVFVDASTEYVSKSYTFVNQNAPFVIEALKAPFDQRDIVLELYYLSTGTVIDTYDLEDVFGTGTTKVWTDMLPTDAIELPYLEKDEDYAFRIKLKSPAMQGPTDKYPAPVPPAPADGKNTFDPASSVMEALNRWEVKWTTNGTYTGQTTARYAGNYQFGLTIAALDSLKYSYPTTPFTFYYKINPVKYDLKDLDWNYITGTTQYIYDGTAKTVEIVGTFPDGLTVGSYVVTGYDRNSQISAKYDPSDLTLTTTTNYKTCVKFVNSNPNYITPVMGDPTTYLDTNAARVAASADFPWVVVWSIEKAQITDLWQNTLSSDGTSSAYVPTLTTHGSKVDYAYYMDDGAGGWIPVTSFEHTGTVNFKVEATLKSNPSDPALDYANNYDLTVTNSTPPMVNTLVFTLGPGSGISVDVVIRDGTPEQSMLTGGDPSPLPLPANNVFVYDGNAFSATLLNFICIVPTTMDENNIVLTYYNVSNKFRPISAPTEPGHYMIKIKLINVPNDGNEYTLQFTEYYFDIEKGTFDPDDIYWRYTHTDSNGFYTEAKYDDSADKWIVVRDTDSTWDGIQWVGGKAGMAIDFVYDGADHKVELYYAGTDGALNVIMKSGSVKINANTEEEPKYNAIASFSFNGKLWNDPAVTTTREWKIEKATVDMTTLNWDYPATGFTYTRVNGEAKGFNVVMKGIDPLLANYVSYKFYRWLDDDGFKYKEQSENPLDVFTEAGKYRTEFIIDEVFAKENTNYKLGPNPLADGNPFNLTSTLDWTIDTRIIDVPTASGLWTEFDGKEHNMLTAYSIQPDWEEYYSIKIEYKAVKASSFMNYADYKEAAIAEFGSEYSAMHAGDYKMLFSINDKINVADMQPNVQWRKATGALPPLDPYEYIDKDVVVNGDNVEYKITSDMTIDQAEMTVDYWNMHDEASTVALTGSSIASNKFVDYVFFADDGSSITSVLAGTAMSIDQVLANPGNYAIKVYVLGEYKSGPNKDINDFTNDIVVNAGPSSGQELYYRFTMLGVGPAVPAKVLPNLVYINGYSEDKGGDTVPVYHEFTYAEWQDMLVKQGLVDTREAGFKWEDILGPAPTPAKEDATDDEKAAAQEAYKKFNDPTADGTTYDVAKQIKIAKLKAQVQVDVIYGGYPITFHVNGWNGIKYIDNFTVSATPVLDNINYKDYLDKWQGEFTHNEVGKFSTTLLLNKTTGYDLGWSYDDLNTNGNLDIGEINDRKSVKLVYSISYRTLDPHAEAVKKNLPTYNGSEYDILQYAWDKEFAGTDIGGYDKILTEEFKNYVEITGATATAVGKYTVYLKIKDEYFNTIRWYVKDNPKGQPGTFKIEWEILPIYVEVPTKVDPDEKTVKIIYDREGHSVLELLKGYNGGKFADDSNLGVLLQVATISGDRAVDANYDKEGKLLSGMDHYTAKFRLPDSNYAWIEYPVDSDPKIDRENLEKTVTWHIYQKELDLSKIAWGYVDADGKEHEATIVDKKAEFQYTVEDGVVQPHELRLIGIPDEISDVITYLTGETEGSVRTEMGDYHTIVFLDGRNVDKKNYTYTVPEEFKNAYKAQNDGDFEIDWRITERKFNVPKDCEVPFDGTVREILDLFTNADKSKVFGEGWENYLDVTIEYKPLDADDSEYADYYDIASADEKVEFSMYKAFYLGSYRIKFSIKSGLNDSSTCVVWMNGTEKETVNQQATVTITPLELVIDGWKDDVDNAESYVIESEEYDALSKEAKEVFAYVIKDEATGEVVEAKDVKTRGAGIYYTIEFVIADGNDYAKELGMKISCASGVDNPYEFCTDNYPASQQGDVKYWLPKIIYTPTGTSTYNAVDKEYTITNWSAYAIPSSFAPADVDLTGKTHFIELAGVIGENSDCVKFDAATGKITVSKAGGFTLNFRFIPNLNLSWYDSPYTFDGVNLKDGSGVNVTTTTSPSLDDLTNKKAQSINIKIEKASVPQITDNQLDYYASLIADIEWTGYEINLQEREDTKVLFDILKTTYGSLIDFEGYRATAAGEYKLIIKLKDKDSSYWDLNVKETVVVNDKSFADYDDSYELMWIEESGKWIVAYVKPDGKGGYVKYNDGNYSLDIKYVMEKLIDAYVAADGLLDEDGRPETASGAKYVVDENGIAIRYSIVGDAYVEDPDGAYIAKYKLMADNSIMEMPVMKDGRSVIDTENSVVTIVRDVTSTDSYEITWRITANKLATPTVNENITLVYNGKEQSAESVLKGFNSTYMEIVEGGVGKNAGEYTAKIRVKATDTDHEWSDPEETIDGVDYVYVTWKIEKADIDLSNAQWVFTDGTNVYPNGEGMIYTRKDGKAVIYWAELVNIPEALNGSIRYTTNGVVGAYAGRDAGKYKTSFEIVDTANNFNTITKPDTLAEEVVWNIQRRMLEIPSALGSFTFIFDDQPHDLLAMLGVPEDWAEYYTIDVMYAKNFVVYTAYAGHDGNPYEAYGAGGYKFVFDIISGINKNKDNPNVVWLKPSGEIEVPVVDDVETPSPEEQPATQPAKKALIKLSAEEEVEEEICKTVEETTAKQVKTTDTQTENHTPTVVEVVCDRLKELAYGAELQLKSRKYTR